MNGWISRVLTTAAVLFCVGLVMLAIPSFSDPEVEVVNNSHEAVSVKVTWRGNEREIGNIQPESPRRFSLNDEAEIRFKVRYSSGKEIESEPMYFSSGTKIIAIVWSNDIEVRYAFGA